MKKITALCAMLVATSVLGMNVAMASTHTNHKSTTGTSKATASASSTKHKSTTGTSDSTSGKSKSKTQSNHVIHVPNNFKVAPSKLTYVQEVDWVKAFMKKHFKVTNEAMLVQEFHSTKGNYYVGYALTPKGKGHLVYFVNESIVTSQKQLTQFIGNKQDLRIVDQALGLD